MKSFIIIFVSCYVVQSRAIECGVDKSNSIEMRQALATCVKNNETLNKIWEMTSLSQAVPQSVETERDSMEENNERDVPSSSAKNTKTSKGSRIKRAKSAKSSSNQRSSTTTMRSTDNSNSMKESDEEENKGGNDSTEETQTSSQDTPEKCIIHCVLEELGMTDDNGLPDHSKILEELMKNASKRELKNFLQDSTDECFQEIDEANETDSCEYSNKLVMCLAEKGKSNCADWPAGSLPF